MDKKVKLALGAAGAAFSAAWSAAALAQATVIDTRPLVALNLSSGEDCKSMFVERKKLDDFELEGYEWFKSKNPLLLYIKSDRGEELAGYFLPPPIESDMDKIAFLCHGFASTAFRDPMLFARRYYEELGYGIFIMDHTACGSSGGRYIGFSGFESDDCIKWIEYLNHEFEEYKIVIHGVSMGGSTVVRMCGDPRLPANVKLCVDDCGFTSAYDEMVYEMNCMKVPVHPTIEMFDLVNKLRARYSLHDCDALERVKKAKIPVVFIHGGNDTYVPLEMAQKLYDACPTDKELLIVKDATHACSVLYDMEAYWKAVKTFTDKYMK